MPDTSKLRPFNDPRVSLRSALLNSLNYGYLYSAPQGGVKKDTIILIHGFPDISFGWRYQVPFLTSLGLEVIAIDCPGYGRTDAPSSSHLSFYTFKRVADDVAELCRQLHLSSVILGGHDWGGAIVYRIAQYHPSLIKAVFAVCTPYPAPNPTYQPLALIVEKALPNFAYQLCFTSGDVETHVQSPLELRKFLDALYGARGPNKELGFTPEDGVLFENLPMMGKNRLLSDEEMDYYVAEYDRHGINGPLNWYRNRELNYLDEWRHPAFYDNGRKHMGRNDEPRIKGLPILFVQATNDGALKPFMADKMEQRIEKLTWKKLDAGHWALWQKPDECNRFIGDWLRDQVWGASGNDVSRGSKL